MRARVRCNSAAPGYRQQCMLGHLTNIVCMLHAGLPHEVQGLATLGAHTRLAQLQELCE